VSDQKHIKIDQNQQESRMKQEFQKKKKKILDFPVGESNPGLPRSEQTAGRLTGGYTDHYTNREMDESKPENTIYISSQ
jgi:hypothetical protein